MDVCGFSGHIEVAWPTSMDVGVSVGQQRAVVNTHFAKELEVA